MFNDKIPGHESNCPPLTKTHKAYFEAAKAVSKLSKCNYTHIGSVAVYNHKIISSGYNSDKTDPLQKKFNIYRFTEESPASLHAEIRCLKPLMGNKSIDFSKVTLYVYREYKNGELAMARPCKSCEKLIRTLGIKKVYYTHNNGYVFECFYGE